MGDIGLDEMCGPEPRPDPGGEKRGPPESNSDGRGRLAEDDDDELMLDASDDDDARRIHAQFKKNCASKDKLQAKGPRAKPRPRKTQPSSIGTRSV